MSFSPITDRESSTAITSIDSWSSNYKETFIEAFHDLSQLTLVLPDDCIFVSGPPRVSDTTSDYYVIGMASNFQYSETRQIQPLKAIGSRRHIFAATNSPVQGSIGRLMMLAPNMYHAFFMNAEVGDDIKSRNTKFVTSSGSDYSAWWTNAEEDMFRVPFGLGVIYNAPASAAGAKKNAFAEYFEVCTIVNRSVALQAGQAMIMEQVSFMCDRVVPWSYGSQLITDDCPKAVSAVSDMAG